MEPERTVKPIGASLPGKYGLGQSRMEAAATAVAEGNNVKAADYGACAGASGKDKKMTTKQAVE